MNIKTKLTVASVVIAVVGHFSEVQLQAQRALPQTDQGISTTLEQPFASAPRREAATAQGNRRAIRGDVATGSVIDTPGSELRLNVSPCGGPPVVIVFQQPYSRSTRGQKNCGGQTVTIEQIQQN